MAGATGKAGPYPATSCSAVSRWVRARRQIAPTRDNAGAGGGSLADGAVASCRMQRLLRCADQQTTEPSSRCGHRIMPHARCLPGAIVLRCVCAHSGADDTSARRASATRAAPRCTTATLIFSSDARVGSTLRCLPSIAAYPPESAIEAIAIADRAGDPDLGCPRRCAPTSSLSRHRSRTRGGSRRDGSTRYMLCPGCARRMAPSLQADLFRHAIAGSGRHHPGLRFRMELCSELKPCSTNLYSNALVQKSFLP